MTIDTSFVKALDLRTLVGNYTQLSGHGEMVGPCPKCGGTDRFHVKRDSWFCRQCHPDFDDAIAFIRWLDGCTFTDAIAKLSGIVPEVTKRQPVAKTTEHKPLTDEWRAKANAIAEEAHKTLMQGDGGIGGKYLDSRALTPDSWVEFNLGFAPAVALPGTWDDKQRTHTQPKQPAIVIPWYRGGKITAIRYRFLETHSYPDSTGKMRVAKQSALFDSDFSAVLYGGQALLGCAEDLRTLVLCEGELNAISIWQQCHNWNWDVLSLGSESAKLSPAALEYAKKFERVIIWMDRREIVTSLMHDVPNAYGIKSPMFGDKKRDANDLLKADRLGEMLAVARYNACQSDTEKKRHLYNLQDASGLPGGIDTGTLEALMKIKTQTYQRHYLEGV